MARQSWLQDAVIYQIYPQSFADSNGDGIGDLRGVIEKLDYIASLGVDAIWFNPCFESPFVDAGYDVADYLRIAPRYGTNQDMFELIAQAKIRGIKIILDLVAGHTSIEHAWFQQELNASEPAPEGDRYVWCEELAEGWDSDLPGTPAWVKSPGPRTGWYLKNFYDEQPALNFGWVNIEHPWQDAPDAPGPRRNVQALIDIMDYWLGHGIAGFRVDMAFSLVKGYDRIGAEHQAAKIWQEVRNFIDAKYPATVLIPEGSEPRVGGQLAFDVDFFLVIFAAHASLFDNGYAGKLPFHEYAPAYFDAAGQGSTKIFEAAWSEIKGEDSNRLVMMGSADHDFDRLASGARTQEQLAAAFAFLLTWGTVPVIWYGDEIGMRYLQNLPNKEGSICNPDYNRAGCRTPMQWDSSQNAGFSSAAEESLYLPIDDAADRPTVLAQEVEPSSVLHTVRALTNLRRETAALRAGTATKVVHSDYPLVYLRGETHLVAVNPKGETVEFQSELIREAQILLQQSTTIDGDSLKIAAFGFAILKLAK